MNVLITVPACPLFERPDFQSLLSDEVLYGSICQVVGSPCPGWYRIRTPYRYEGYAPSGCLLPDEEAAGNWMALHRKVVLRKNWCDILSQPTYQSQLIVTLPRGAVVAPLEQLEDGWVKVALCNGETGYTKNTILSEYYETPIPLPESELRQRLIDTAMLYRGTPYRWGGKTPQGLDCSGLTSMTYLLNGIVIFRNSKLMDGFPIHAIPLERAKAGDLIYFTGHICLYLGDYRYLHVTGKMGSDGVSINSLEPNAPDFRPDLLETFLTAGTYFI